MDFSETVGENTGCRDTSVYLALRARFRATLRAGFFTDLTDSTTYVVESGGAFVHRTEGLTGSDLP